MPMPKFNIGDRVKSTKKGHDPDTYEISLITISAEVTTYKLKALEPSFGYGPWGEYSEEDLEFISDLHHFENKEIAKMSRELEGRVREYHKQDCGGTLAGYLYPYLRARLLGRES